MKRVLAISNRKGGCGKTTTVVNVSAALARRGNKVLVIDSDPQAHSTLSFGISPDKPRPDLHAVLTGESRLSSAILRTHVPNLEILPGSRRSAQFERENRGRHEARVQLRDTIRALNGAYDYVLIDTAPTLSLLTVASLIAANEVYVPMLAHFLCLDGLAEMTRLCKEIQGIYREALPIKGVIPTFFNLRMRLSRDVIRDIRAGLGEHILMHPVRMNCALAEAPSFGQSIFDYDPSSNGARDYLRVAEQIEELQRAYEELEHISRQR